MRHGQRRVVMVKRIVRNALLRFQAQVVLPVGALQFFAGREVIGEDEKTYSINPLNWKTTEEVADKSLNKGACFTDYSGNINEEIF